MTTHQTLNIKFTESNIDDVFEALVSTDKDLKDSFYRYIKEEYKGLQIERLNYFDIAEISRYIINKLKNKQTEKFHTLFDTVENILASCDRAIENLIVVGLFEGIQNVGGQEINYYTGLDAWLKPLSKSKWDNLVDFWEGNDWRTNK